MHFVKLDSKPENSFNSNTNKRFFKGGCSNCKKCEHKSEYCWLYMVGL